MVNDNYKMCSRKDINPPAIAEKILGMFLPENERPVLLGDYEELFQDRAAEKGVFSAVTWYWIQILITLPEFVFSSSCWSIIMIKNYLKVTIRTLLKNKVFSIINITSIALSISICLMIIIYINDWRTADQFQENNDRIFRIYTTDNHLDWDVHGYATTPAYLAPHLLESYPNIDEAVRLRRMGANVLYKRTTIYVKGYYADDSFFDVFNFQLKKGDPITALDNPFSIVLSEEYAQIFFGDEDPMGKILTVENSGNYTVTGILKDNDEKTHLNFKSLISFSTINSLVAGGLLINELEDWKYMDRYYTYVLINDLDNISRFDEQLLDIGNTIIPEKELDQYGFKLQNICDINLGKNLRNSTPGTKSSIDVFFIPFLAAMIVFLVCFNYIILSIARSLKRSKEIGLRKVIGSKRSQIIKLFLSEAFVITLLALITACIFIIWLIPVFNNLDAIENSKQQINLEMMKDPGIYIDFILVAIVISLLAGLYPALYLSSIRPLNALQGVSKIIGFTHLLTRKILMGIQFGVSLLSIIIILYYNQLSDFWMNYDRGISADNIVNVYLGDMNYETVRNEISKNSMFTRVSFSSEAPLYGQTSYTSFRMENMTESLRAFYFNIDNEFIDNFKLKLLAGRNFSKDYSTDAGNAVIVNEKTVQALGYESPDMVIGKVLTLRDDSEVTVIGVVKDYTYRTFFEKEIGPVVIISKPDGFLCANIRYLPEKEDEIKATLPEIWKKFTEAYPVGYSFSNDELEEYEDNISGGLIISSWAGGFVILIALFGLLGMTAYTTELRVKEIGIRKVLGATVRGSVYLLSKGYVKLIILTGAITLPTGYILTALMFQFFPIKPGLSLLVPPAALLFILLLAFITVGSQTIKAALANPVNTLRED